MRDFTVTQASCLCLAFDLNVSHAGILPVRKTGWKPVPPFLAMRKYI